MSFSRRDFLPAGKGAAASLSLINQIRSGCALAHEDSDDYRKQNAPVVLGGLGGSHGKSGRDWQSRQADGAVGSLCAGLGRAPLGGDAWPDSHGSQFRFLERRRGPRLGIGGLLLAAVDTPEKLGAGVREAIGSEENRVLVSAGTLWELSINAGLGKLKLPEGFFEELAELGYETLGIEDRHLAKYRELPLHHRDPFERLSPVEFCISTPLGERRTRSPAPRRCSAEPAPPLQAQILKNHSCIKHHFYKNHLCE